MRQLLHNSKKCSNFATNYTITYGEYASNSVENDT